MILKYVNKTNKFKNIKQIAKQHFNMSERLILKLKNKQLIFKNGNICKITDTILQNDIIEFNLEYDEFSDNIIPTYIDLKIIYEDDYMLVVDKPPFIPVHPSLNYYENSLSNGVKYYFNKINLNKKIRPINRLDKDTSGIVLFAKNEYIQEALIKQMLNSNFKKKYLAILTGVLENKKGTIKAPILRKEDSIIEREINPNGQNAITNFYVLDTKNNLSLVEFTLLTGRTHQIRVHSKYINHPILGDSLYGTKTNLINRQALHAYKVSFIHPITKKTIYLETALPADIKNAFYRFI